MPLLLKRRPRVVITLSNVYQTHREILRGILRFTQQHTPWVINLQTGRAGEPSAANCVASGCSGLITNSPDERLLALARERRIPVVTFDQDRRLRGVVANIRCGNEEIGVAAARHFIQIPGLAACAFVGEASGRTWSITRGQAFARELHRLKRACEVYPTVAEKGRANAAREQARLANWISHLPSPIGIFAAYDLRARQVLDICFDLGLNVPDDVVLLGVDNDELICTSTTPTLSSIALDTENAGYRAAQLLDAALSTGNRSPHRSDIVYSVREIVSRQSTARTERQDELVRRCRELIEANADTRFSITDLVSALRISRRTLENHFKAATGQTLAAAIQDIRLERAKTLLRTTSRSQMEIASRCGFCDASHLSSVFRRCFGAVPSTFRIGH